MDILNLLFPRRCLGCGKIGRYFCSKCVLKINRIDLNKTIYPVRRSQDSLDGVISFFHYRGIIRQAIKTLKYRLVTDLAKELVDLISLSSFSKASVLVPIPLHSARLRSRGFNQAEVLGSLIANKLNIPIESNLLKRVKNTQPQAEVKNRVDRLKNIGQAFAVDQIKQYPKRVILFDDVFTTGATMRGAASALKQAGVKYVWGMTIAR